MCLFYVSAIHPAFISIALYYNMKSRKVMLPDLLLFIFFCYLRIFVFLLKKKITFSVSVNTSLEILVRIPLKL